MYITKSELPRLHRLRLLRSQVLRALINSAGPLADRLHLAPTAMGADEYIERAAKQTGLHDSLHPSVEQALSRLLESVYQEAKLNFFGRLSFHFDTMRLLSNLLWLTETRKRTPEIGRENIREPIFITGLPRTASTFLHTLFMLDPANRAPRVWEVAYPRACESHDQTANVWEGRVRRELASLDLLEPDFRNVHPIGANSPQECTEILSNIFESLRFDSTYDVPTYRKWVDAQPAGEAYAFHREFLQFLQYKHGSHRWVLKSPDHVFAVDGIRFAYPDAKIIVTHRDPSQVIPSVAAQTMVLHGLFSDAARLKEIFQKVHCRWIKGSQQIMKMTNDKGQDPSRITHVFYRDLVANPLRVVKKLYDSLGLVLSDEAKERMRRYLSNAQTGRYRGNRYQKAVSEIKSKESLRTSFKDYIAMFDIPLES